MLRMRFVYALIASLSVLVAGAIYHQLRPEPARPAPTSAPAAAPAAASDTTLP
jgi:hypothetical protein